MENHTAKNFALQLGSLASLYISLSFLIVLIFGIINILYPDAASDYWMVEQAHSSVRLGIAMVIVFFPTYLVLTRMVNSARRSENNGVYLALTKWLIYLSLLVGGAVLLGDLVAVIMSFLEGELTQRFILKAGALFIIVGVAFYYYILDARGHWLTDERKSIMFAIAATLVVAASVGYGFTHIDTPSAVREQKLDATQVTDLQQLQWRIQDHAVVNGTLPGSLEELSNGTIPTAPEERPDYEYKVTADGFELCATFAQASTDSENYMYQGSVMIDEKMMIKNPDNWQHEAGAGCFKRIINQALPK
jgi:Domain of unknown function (DUF5671)